MPRQPSQWPQWGLRWNNSASWLFRQPTATECKVDKSFSERNARKFSFSILCYLPDVKTVLRLSCMAFSRAETLAFSIKIIRQTWAGSNSKFAKLGPGVGAVTASSTLQFRQKGLAAKLGMVPTNNNGPPWKQHHRASSDDDALGRSKRSCIIDGKLRASDDRKLETCLSEKAFTYIRIYTRMRMPSNC